jgi:hypothetical protein
MDTFFVVVAHDDDDDFCDIAFEDASTPLLYLDLNVDPQIQGMCVHVPCLMSLWICL